mgnify:CR=1 FL=1
MTRLTERRVENIEANLAEARHDLQLVGIDEADGRSVFARQLVDSERFMRRLRLYGRQSVCEANADPFGPYFHPLKAAAHFRNAGNIEEAIWITFLAVHFGQHHEDGWHAVSRVYGRIGDEGTWDWHSTSGSIPEFRHWLASQGNAITVRFGNHRKYQSTDLSHPNGTGRVVESYVRWVGSGHSQEERYSTLVPSSYDRFAAIYRSLTAVYGFGRLAKFDLLTRLRYLNLIKINAPRSAYLSASTGPIAGARLLCTNDHEGEIRTTLLDERIAELGNRLNLGMDVLEDALCNWQKSPHTYEPFIG